MVYIGIDSSTTNTAVVVIYDDTVEPKLVSPKSKDILERSENILRSVLDVIQHYPPRDTIIGIEAASFNSRGARDKLSMLLGAIYYALRIKGYKIELIPPTTIKKKFTGSGKAKKEDMEEYVPFTTMEQFKAIGKKTDDLVDAYAIATILKRAGD